MLTEQPLPQGLTVYVQNLTKDNHHNYAVVLWQFLDRGTGLRPVPGEYGVSASMARRIDGMIRRFYVGEGKTLKGGNMKYESKGKILSQTQVRKRLLEAESSLQEAAQRYGYSLNDQHEILRSDGFNTGAYIAAPRKGRYMIYLQMRRGPTKVFSFPVSHPGELGTFLKEFYGAQERKTGMLGDWPEGKRRRLAEGGIVAVDEYRRGVRGGKGRTRTTHVKDSVRSWPVKHRKGRGLHGATAEYADLYDALSDAGRELVLFMENDGNLWRQGESIRKNLVRKMLKGVFDEAKAAKLYLYWVNNGAQKYAKEFAEPGAKGFTMFPMKDRRAVAAYFARKFHDLYDSGEYKGLKGAGSRRRSQPYRKAQSAVSADAWKQPIYPHANQCECADPGCPVHKGREKCENRGTTKVSRIDMGEPATFKMCEGCAADALDSGVFA
jgi:hypothetical protein